MTIMGYAAYLLMNIILNFSILNENHPFQCHKQKYIHIYSNLTDCIFIMNNMVISGWLQKKSLQYNIYREKHTEHHTNLGNMAARLVKHTKNTCSCHSKLKSLFPLSTETFMEAWKLECSTPLHHKIQSNTQNTANTLHISIAHCL